MLKIGLFFFAVGLLLVFFPTRVEAVITFEDVTAQVGLIEPLRGMMGHAAAWGDVNGDGYLDLFYGNFADRQGGPEDKLFINNQGNSFTEVKGPYNVKGRCSGAAFADFDNDGDLDLVVSHNKVSTGGGISGEGNHIYENDGSGNFTDRTSGSNLSFSGKFTGRNTFVLDYDGDGKLDVLMEEDAVSSGAGKHSRLMKNLGNFVFQDVTNQAGIGTNAFGLGGFVGDINGDTWPDIYLAHGDDLFINDRDGTFTKAPYSLHPGGPQSRDWPCGADLGDLDQDGDMDMIVGDHYKDSPEHLMRVFLNQGNDGAGIPIFQNVTTQVGMKNVGKRQPHVQIEDLDNDGDMDLVGASCHDFVYTNTGVSGGLPKFSGPTASGTSACGIGYWVAAPLGDYDRDGRLDFIGPQWDTGTRSPLMRNVTAGSGDYLDVAIDAPNSGANRHGIGATVGVYRPGQAGNPAALLGVKVISISNGYSSGTPAIAHFGVSGQATVDVVVTMPHGGPVYSAPGQQTNRLVTITGGGPPPVSPTPTPPTGGQPLCFGANGTIDGDDALSWAAGYLQAGSLPDVNADGRINVREFGYLVAYWGESCQSP